MDTHPLSGAPSRHLAVTPTAEEGVSYINAAGEEIPDVVVRQAVDGTARQIANWVESQRGQSSFYDRQAYVAPDSPYALFRIARTAVENDDVVGGVADVTEGLMFQGLKWESEDADDADVFNQIAKDLNLDEVVRTWYREDYTYSQAVMGMWWGVKTYRVRGRKVAEEGGEERPNPLTGIMEKIRKRVRGRPRRKEYQIYCPQAIAFLDPMRVVPLPPGPFGQDRLAWHASPGEHTMYKGWMDEGVLPTEVQDAVMAEFFDGVVPLASLSRETKAQIGRWGMNPGRLIYLRPDRVFRYTRTKSTYEQFAQLRLKSTFPLLDLKQQLMEADRVALVGAINYILLVRKGTEKDPASQDEIDNLKENFRIVAKLPVIIGDHRLEIDVIIPEQEYVLKGDRYDTLDRRILSRVLGALTISSGGQRNESTLTVARGVARQLESRRHMMKRVLEREIAHAVCEHPANAGKFEDEPNMAFTPRNVSLDSDAIVTQAMLQLRENREISRETLLEYFSLDQSTEAQRREYEEESGLDDVFKTEVPFSATGPLGQQGQPGAQPGQQSPAAAGRKGGRPQGGGRGSRSRKAGPKTDSGNPSTAQE